nr:uncharacterized protein LOC109157532 [Ipomoea batatas]
MFTILNDYRKLESLSKRLNIIVSQSELSPSQQEPILPLPSIQPQDNVPTENLPYLPIETQNTTFEESHTILPFETLPELPIETNNEPYLVEPSIKKGKEKARGKKKITVTDADTNPVQKIKVFPKSSHEKYKTQKRRKKNAAETPSPLVDLKMDLSSIVPLQFTKPQFLTDEYAYRWDSINKREILAERFLDIEKLKSKCQLLPILEKINLIRTVNKLKDYPLMAIKEFYANLMPTINEPTSPLYGRVNPFHSSAATLETENQGPEATADNCHAVAHTVRGRHVDAILPKAAILLAGRRTRERWCHCSAHASRGKGIPPLLPAALHRRKRKEEGARPPLLLTSDGEGCSATLTVIDPLTRGRRSAARPLAASRCMKQGRLHRRSALLEAEEPIAYRWSRPEFACCFNDAYYREPQPKFHGWSLMLAGQ